MVTAHASCVLSAVAGINDNGPEAHCGVLCRYGNCK